MADTTYVRTQDGISLDALILYILIPREKNISELGKKCLSYIRTTLTYIHTFTFTVRRKIMVRLTVLLDLNLTDACMHYYHYSRDLLC